MFQKRGTCLVVNLAISDFLYCCLATLRNADADRFLHLVVCSRYFISASVLTIASVSVDRFLMVACPFKHRFFMKRKVVIVWVAVIWILSLVCLLKFLFGEKRMYNILMHSVVVSVILFAAILYTVTSYKLKKQASDMASSTNRSPSHDIRLSREKQFLGTIFIITCILMVCYLPIAIFYGFIYSRGLIEKDKLSEILLDIFSVMLNANFAVNPLIYFLRLPNYRKTFFLLYSCRRKIG